MEMEIEEVGGTRDLHVNVRSSNDQTSWAGRGRSSPPPRKEGRGQRKTGSSTSLSWESNTTWWNDPEAKRKRRVAKYKLYGVEGKVKRSLKKGYRWMKIKCIKIIRSL